MSPAPTTSMPPRLGGYWVIALSLAAQAWPPSNEAPRPVMRPSSLDSVRYFERPPRRCLAGELPVRPKKDWVGVAMAWVPSHSNGCAARGAYALRTREVCSGLGRVLI